MQLNIVVDSLAFGAGVTRWAAPHLSRSNLCSQGELGVRSGSRQVSSTSDGVRIVRDSKDCFLCFLVFLFHDAEAMCEAACF